MFWDGFYGWIRIQFWDCFFLLSLSRILLYLTWSIRGTKFRTNMSVLSFTHFILGRFIPKRSCVGRFCMHVLGAKNSSNMKWKWFMISSILTWVQHIWLFLERGVALWCVHSENFLVPEHRFISILIQWKLLLLHEMEFTWIIIIFCFKCWLMFNAYSYYGIN